MLSLFLLIAVWLQAAHCWNANNCRANGLCFDSFRSKDWVDGLPAYPDRVPESFTTFGSTILISYKCYDISWVGADASYPLELRWISPAAPEFPGQDPSAPEPVVTIDWRRNFTTEQSGTYKFCPEQIINEITNATESNTTSDRLSWLTLTDGTNLIITQPGRPEISGDPAMRYIPGVETTWGDRSFRFYVAPVDVEYWFKSRDERANDVLSQTLHDWKQGVGVGVGVGVPFLLLFTLVAGVLHGSRHPGKFGRLSRRQENVTSNMRDTSGNGGGNGSGNVNIRSESEVSARSRQTDDALLPPYQS